MEDEGRNGILPLFKPDCAAYLRHLTHQPAGQLLLQSPPILLPEAGLDGGGVSVVVKKSAGMNPQGGGNLVYGLCITYTVK